MSSIRHARTDKWKNPMSMKRDDLIPAALCRFRVQETFSLEPARLRSRISPGHIALLVLERPWHHDDGIAFAHPRPLFHLALYTAHPRNVIQALDA